MGWVTCPFKSTWNRYVPNPFSIGRDSIRERSTPRTANSVNAATRDPGSFRRVNTTAVRSTPVGAGDMPVGPTTTNRVRAPATSAMFSATTVR